MPLVHCEANHLDQFADYCPSRSVLFHVFHHILVVRVERCTRAVYVLTKKTFGINFRTFFFLALIIYYHSIHLLIIPQVWFVNRTVFYTCLDENLDNLPIDSDLRGSPLCREEIGICILLSSNISRLRGKGHFYCLFLSFWVSQFRLDP